MIEFYRVKNSLFCDEIVERLRTLVVAHRVIGADDESNSIVPRIEEGKKMYRRREDIFAFLDELDRQMLVQREMQSDSCIIDPETGDGCL